MPSSPTQLNNAAADRQAYLAQQLESNTNRAFYLLFKEHYASLCYFANFLIDNRTDAEDIVSESYLKLWNRMKKPMVVATIKPFLVVVTRNACFDYLKHNKVKAKANHEILYTAIKNDESIEAHLLKAEILQEAIHVVDRLPVRMRKVFKLAFGLKQLSNAEIAAQLNITESTVRVQKSKALVMIREALRTTSIWP